MQNFLGRKQSDHHLVNSCSAVLSSMLIGLTVLILQGCDVKINDEAVDINTGQGEHDNSVDGLNKTSEKVLAEIGDKKITQAQIDETIQLKLFNLEWAKYELRQQALAERLTTELAVKKVSHKRVNVLIEPPMPPRLKLTAEGQPSFGSITAPITLSIFCSYQSSHCGRMQETYQRLSDSYPGKIRFVFYDFPQNFHRFAKLASHAARCVGTQKFWPFHKGLWAKQANLEKDTYLQLAAQLEVDSKLFSACMSENKYAQAVQSNIALAESFGFSNVPVTLVNGLYLNGPKDINTLRFFVDKELARLHLEPKEKELNNRSKPEEDKTLQLTQTRLPLRLEGVFKSEEQASAMIHFVETDISSTYLRDDEILPGVFLVVIESTRVIIENQGRMEYLDTASDIAGAAIEPEKTFTHESAALEAGKLTESEEVIESAPEGIRAEELANAPHMDFELRSVVPALGEMPLSKEWIEQNLMNQVDLQAHFEPAEHVVEGVHILKLAGVAENTFYQTLGLEDGDVVLRVNNEWVHEAQNTLFASLEEGGQVDVVLMRKGLPVHLKYMIN